MWIFIAIKDSYCMVPTVESAKRMDSGMELMRLVLVINMNITIIYFTIYYNLIFTTLNEAENNHENFAFASWVKEKHLIIDLYTRFSLKKKKTQKFILMTIFVDISLLKIVFEFAKVAYKPAGNVTSYVNRLIKKIHLKIHPLLSRSMCIIGQWLSIEKGTWEKLSSDHCLVPVRRFPRPSRSIHFCDVSEANVTRNGFDGRNNEAYRDWVNVSIHQE